MSFYFDDLINNETIDALLDEKKFNYIFELLKNKKIKDPSFGLIHIIELNCNMKLISAKFLFDNFGLKSMIYDKYVINNFDEYVDFCEKEVDNLYGNNSNYFSSIFKKTKSYEEIINEFPLNYPKYEDHKEFFNGRYGVKNKFDNMHLKGETCKFYNKIMRKYGNGKTQYKSSECSFFDFPYKIKPFNYFLERVILKILSSLVINNTQNFRKHKGVPLSGEGWVSETDLFQKIKNHFNTLKVVQHGKPKWLKRQHVDIWIPEYKIGVEFHGEQHFKPVEFFGGEKAFQKNIERDIRKKELFKKNNSHLLIVRDGYIFTKLVKKINEITNKTKKVSVKNEVTKPKLKKSYHVVEIDDNIFDCKELKTIKLEEMNRILKKQIFLSAFKRRKSIDGRFILEKNKENSTILSNWKTVFDKSSNTTERHNLKSFSKKVGVNQNNVWNFFNGKQKYFRGQYSIIETFENE